MLVIGQLHAVCVGTAGLLLGLVCPDVVLAARLAPDAEPDGRILLLKAGQPYGILYPFLNLGHLDLRAGGRILLHITERHIGVDFGVGVVVIEDVLRQFSDGHLTKCFLNTI